MTILDTIVGTKRTEVQAKEERCPLRLLKKQAETSPLPRDFLAALRRPDIALIAEIKKASPRMGVIRESVDPAMLAQCYQDSGADAISVLTDEPFFQGSLSYLRDVRSISSLPVLRKDFIIDDYQIYESRAAGADAVLLIATVLDQSTLKRMLKLCKVVGLAALVEVHDEQDVKKAVLAGAQIIGINNRDLSTFRVDLATTEKLAIMIQDGQVVVSESGIKNREDVIRVAMAGAKAILVGETLMRSDDVVKTVRQLLGG